MDDNFQSIVAAVMWGRFVQTPNPKPQTLNPKPELLANPKPETDMFAHPQFQANILANSQPATITRTHRRKRTHINTLMGRCLIDNVSNFLNLKP
jgi:hypothetical protein